MRIDRSWPICLGDWPCSCCHLYGAQLRIFGGLAVAALAINIILIVAALSALQATLTLPGIAGIVLTWG